MGLEESGWDFPVVKSRNVSLTSEPGLTCWVLNDSIRYYVQWEGGITWEKKDTIPEDDS